MSGKGKNVRLNIQVPRDLLDAYKREAERRGVTLDDLVRARLEGDPWYALSPVVQALLDRHLDMLRANVPKDDPERVEVERKIGAYHTRFSPPPPKLTPEQLARAASWFGTTEEPSRMTDEGNDFARKLLGEEAKS